MDIDDLGVQTKMPNKTSYVLQIVMRTVSSQALAHEHRVMCTLAEEVEEDAGGGYCGHGGAIGETDVAEAGEVGTQGYIVHVNSFKRTCHGHGFYDMKEREEGERKIPLFHGATTS